MVQDPGPIVSTWEGSVEFRQHEFGETHFSDCNQDPDVLLAKDSVRLHAPIQECFRQLDALDSEGRVQELRGKGVDGRRIDLKEPLQVAKIFLINDPSKESIHTILIKDIVGREVCRQPKE